MSRYKKHFFEIVTLGIAIAMSVVVIVMPLIRTEVRIEDLVRALAVGLFSLGLSTLIGLRRKVTNSKTEK